MPTRCCLSYTLAGGGGSRAPDNTSLTNRTDAGLGTQPVGLLAATVGRAAAALGALEIIERLSPTVVA